MKFGVFCVLACPEHDFQQAYPELLYQVEYADAPGFEEVWLAEHHSSDYGSMPSPADRRCSHRAAHRTHEDRRCCEQLELRLPGPDRRGLRHRRNDLRSTTGLRRRPWVPARRVQGDGVADKQDVSREVFADALETIRGLWSTPVGTREGGVAYVGTCRAHHRDRGAANGNRLAASDLHGCDSLGCSMTRSATRCGGSPSRSCHISPTRSPLSHVHCTTSYVFTKRIITYKPEEIRWHH